VDQVRSALFGIAGLLLAAAAVLALAGDTVAGKAVAFAFFGIACVIAVSLVFLAIGRAEDAEREASKPKPKPKPPPDPHAGEAARRSRPRPPRRPV
jgi:hypothetical protein